MSCCPPLPLRPHCGAAVLLACWGVIAAPAADTSPAASTATAPSGDAMPSAAAQPPSAATGVADEAGRRALRESAEFPWYDAERDELRRIEVKPPSDVAARRSRWEPPNIAWSWPDWLSALLSALGWVLLTCLAVLLVYLLIRAFLSTGWVGDAASDSDDGSTTGDADRIEALPFHFQVAQGDLLTRARQLYEAGDFSQAIIYLYGYQLIQLDRHQLIRLTKGKTNRQYLRELRRRRELSELLRGSVALFEEVFFGHHRLDQRRFETCWSRLDEFHQHLGQVAT
ncbi:MAG: DUF4129 domain-containing protein [Pirellulaceae bacterium]